MEQKVKQAEQVKTVAEGLESEYKYITLREAVGKVDGRIMSGDGKYPLYGMTAIGSAKEFELCVAATKDDVDKLWKSDADAVLSSYDLADKLPPYLNIIVVDDVKKASDILMDAFRNL